MINPSIPVVNMNGVGRQYRLGEADILALKNVTLDIHCGDFMVIAGPSGSGKTTLLNLIGLIDKPTSGQILLDGKDTTPKSLNSLFRYRRDRIGYVFQTFNLIPVLNVYENIEYPLILKGVSASQRREKVEQAMHKVGLSSRRKHKPRELSGGERQRVSVARAIVKAPELVLADEPTANLDSATGVDILRLMQRLHLEDNTTFVFSSHDPRIIAMGKRVVRLRDGEVETVETR
jgi:putative ABC transport system ATP-binding protein